MNVIKSIQSDVKSVDLNRDGLVDFEDLKELLRSSYSTIYTADEIDEIGELLFVGKSGQPVKTTHLVRGICHIAQAPTDRPNPLKLQNVEDRRYKNDPRDHMHDFYNTQESFDRHMQKYIQEKCKQAAAKVEQEAWEEMDEAIVCMEAGKNG
jgi:hypothetical protein